MTCNEWRAALLSGDHPEGLDGHLAACLECRRLADDLRSAADLLADPLLWEEPPPDLEDRIVGAIERTATAPETHRGSSLRSRWLGLVAAAAMIVAIGGAWLSTRDPAPDWTATLTGVDGTAAAATIAGWNTGSGTRVVLEAPGLDPADPGYAYELWFARDGDEVVSAGTFRTADSVELTVGVARRDYPTIVVTLEPLDGDPRPSGVAVLRSGDA